MGNTQEKKKIPVINKTQLQVACTKARIHLQMMRDRKNAQIIKGQRQLVAKLKSPSRNKVEQLLIAERVVNGLKYAQADHMGLSSLNDFRQVIRSLYDPAGILKYCNQDIVLLLSPTPNPQQINIYMVEMSQRNEIPLEEINIVGHKFTKQWNEPGIQLDQQYLDMKKKLADEMAHKMGGQSGHGGQGGNDFPFGPGGQGSSHPGNGGNQGFPGGQGFSGNQGGYGGNQGGFGNQGGYGNNQNPYDNKPKQQVNPYKGVSAINQGPQYYTPPQVQPQSNEKPHEFTSFDEMMKMTEQKNHKLEIYPDVDPKQYKASQYKPIHNPFTPPEEQQNHNSPTLSQIMRDFDKK